MPPRRNNTCSPWFCAEMPESQCGRGPLFCAGGYTITGTMWLSTGYTFCGILLVYYFVCEDSIVHRSRRTENMFIVMVFSMVQIFAMVAFHEENLLRHADPSFEDAMLLGFRSVQQLRVVGLLRRTVRLILFIHIVHKQASLVRHKPYQDQLLKWESGTPATTRSQRVSEELEALVDDIFSRSRGYSYFDTVDRWLVQILYGMFMLMDLAWISVTVSKWIDGPLIVLEWLLFLYMLWVLVGRVKRLRLGGRSQKLHELVEILVRIREKDTLEAVLTSTSIVNFVEVAEWHTVMLLTETALEEGLLSTLSKGVLLDALQKKGLRKKKVVQEVQRLILSCMGEDLTQLKNSIDEGGDYHNLYKLVYQDLTDTRTRDVIVDHIVSQARALRAERGAVGIKILSDIDDTLFSSGGVFPAGCDERFPKHVVYPGCLTLFRILDKSHTAKAPSCNLIFLSARPHIYKDYAEDRSYKMFKKLVAEGRMHVMPTLLAGELRKGLWAFLTYACLGSRAWQGVGDFKMEMYRRFRVLYHEYDFIFFGDNGQGDLWAGQLMTEHQYLESQSCTSTVLLEAQQAEDPRLLAVVIHRVIPEDRCLARDLTCFSIAEAVGPVRSNSSPGTLSWQASLQQLQVFMHSSYVGAALALHRSDPKLVTAEELAEVARTAVQEFNRMRQVYSEWGSRWDTAEEDLRLDLEEVEEVLQASGLAPEARAVPVLEPTAEYLAQFKLIMPPLPPAPSHTSKERAPASSWHSAGSRRGSRRASLRSRGSRVGFPHAAPPTPPPPQLATVRVPEEVELAAEPGPP